MQRNRARRRISEAIRLVWDLIEPGWDMVLIARPGVNEADFALLQSACLQLLRRAGVLKGTSQPASGASGIGVEGV